MNEPPDQTAVFSDGELVVADRDHRAEVLLEQLRVLAQAGVGVEEDDALLLEVLADLVVDDLGLVLRGDARDEPLLLRLRDAEPVVGVLDVLGQVVPAGRLLLGGPDEVLDVVEVDPDRSAPHVGIGFLPKSRRPLSRRSSIHSGSFFSAGDAPHHGLVEAALGGRAGGVGVGPAVLVVAEAPSSSGVSGLRHRASSQIRRRVRGPRGAARDVRRADTVAVGDGGQSLDVLAEQPGEDLGLGLAQLRELLGHVRDRAVVLAQLRRAPASAVEAAYPSAVSACARTSAFWFSGPRRPATVPLLHVGDPAPGELRDGLVTARLGDEPQRGGRQVVVRLVERVPAGVGEREDLGRTAAAARAVDSLLVGLDQAVVEQVVEVPADRRRGQVEPLRERRRHWTDRWSGSTGGPGPGSTRPATRERAAGSAKPHPEFSTTPVWRNSPDPSNKATLTGSGAHVREAEAARERLHFTRSLCCRCASRGGDRRPRRAVRREGRRRRSQSSPSTAGTVTSVLGPNGAGKTTTVETCEGFRGRTRAGSGCSGWTRTPTTTS